MEVNNMAALRKALKYAREVLALNGFVEPTNRCDAALSKPARNCDVGTPEEQERRWRVNCGDGIPGCKHCKVYEQARKSGFIDDKSFICFDCRFIWAQMPYEAEGDAE